MKIISLDSMQILDSRGNPTLRVDIILEDGSFGRFDVPSGASTGIHEALELRDNDKNLYGGKSVFNVVENVKNLREVLIGKDFTQRELDKELIDFDGTENKSRIGANACIGVSIAFAKALAKFLNIPLYDYIHKFANDLDMKSKISKPGQVYLFANVINGGIHSGNDLNMQEFMIVPVFGSIPEKVRAISETYHVLKDLISKKYGKSSTGVGDEGGFAPEISKATEALDLIVAAIKKAGYENRVFIATDPAISNFYDTKTKLYEIEKDKKLNYKQLTSFYLDLLKNYPLLMIEDPMAEDDFDGFAYFMKSMKKFKSFENPITSEMKPFVVGDDLLVTNCKRVKMAIEKRLCNGLLLKVNQIGTLSEAIDAYNLAKKVGWQIVVSHRSGETTDDFIADLTSGLSASIKLGASARGERIAKYNRFLEIYRNQN